MRFNKMQESIPWGTQTKSKIEISNQITIKSAKNATLTDTNGNNYIDFDCSKGAIILGYSFKDLDDYVKNVIDEGILFPSSSLLEKDAIDLIIKQYIGMSWGRFLTSGVSVNSAACRIVKKINNKRKIIYFSYAGWMDLFTKGETKDSIFIDIYKYDIDCKSFDNICNNASAILITGWEPDKDYRLKINNIVSTARKKGLLVILDLISLGLRVNYDLISIDPDIITLGKSIANGYSCSVILGKEEMRKPIDNFDVIFSETHAGNRIGIAGMYKTLLLYNDRSVFPYVSNLSNILFDKLNSLNKQKIYTLYKYDAIIYIQWISKTHEKNIFKYMLKHGVVYSNYIHLTFSHTVNNVDLFYTLFSEFLNNIEVSQ